MAFKIFLTVLFAIEMVFTVERVGRPRKSITDDDAFWVLIIGAMLIYGVWNWL